MKARLFRPKVVILIVIGSLIGLGFVEFLVWRSVSHFKKEKAQIRLLWKASHQLNKWWYQGDFKGVWATSDSLCPSIGGSDKVDASYTRCSPNFIQCIMEHFQKSGRAPLEIKGTDRKTHRVYLQKFSSGRYLKLINRSVHALPKKTRGHHFFYGELYLEGQSGLKLPLLLRRNCHERYLPQRLYPLLDGKGVVGRRFKKSWDNIGQHIFIDANLASIGEVREFVKESGKYPHLRTAFKDRSDSEWATMMKPGEMEAFCQFRGKALLKSWIFHASALYPGILSRPKFYSGRFGPYPWSRTYKSDPIYKLQYQKTDLKDKAKYCKKIRAKDCSSVKLKYYYPFSPSWTGIYSTLGGPLELLEKGSGEFWIKEASYYFPLSSKKIQIGHLVKWSGVDFSGRSLANSDHPLYQLPELKIGFRCFRYVDN